MEPADLLAVEWSLIRARAHKGRYYYFSYDRSITTPPGLPRFSWNYGNRFIQFGLGQSGKVRSWSATVPTWLPAFLGVLPLLFLAFSAIRRRRIPPGHCRKCRYDLTGNTSGICPECGTPIRPV